MSATKACLYGSMAVMTPTDKPVEEFLAEVPDERRRADAERLVTLMSEITGKPPVIWGGGIVGFGRYHYRYDSGHEGDSPLAAFAPRKPHLVVYLAVGFEERDGAALKRLGPHKTSKSCLYLKRLADVDEGALRELIHRSAQVQPGADVS